MTDVLLPSEKTLPDEFIGVDMDATRGDVKSVEERRESFFEKDGTAKPLEEPVKLISRAD